MADSARELLIVLLCQMVSQRPFSRDRAVAIAERLRTEESMETLVETACGIGCAESYTKVSDATGKAPIPGFMSLAMRRLLPVLRFFHS